MLEILNQVVDLFNFSCLARTGELLIFQWYVSSKSVGRLSNFGRLRPGGSNVLEKKALEDLKLWKINPMKIYFFSAKLEHSSKHLDVFLVILMTKKLLFSHSSIGH